MARFVQAHYPAQHPGIIRFGRVADSFRATIRSFDGSRGTATLLLAALVSALLVVANQLIDTWTEGHLLTAWVLMWLVGFAALALLAAPARAATVSLARGWGDWQKARRAAAEDDKLWKLALTDARVMADLSRAMSRDAALDLRRYY